jgi:hypothetical protein
MIIMNIEELKIKIEKIIILGFGFNKEPLNFEQQLHQKQSIL